MICCCCYFNFFVFLCVVPYVFEFRLCVKVSLILPQKAAAPHQQQKCILLKREQESGRCAHRTITKKRSKKRKKNKQHLVLCTIDTRCAHIYGFLCSRSRDYGLNELITLGKLLGQDNQTNTQVGRKEREREREKSKMNG